ncbi:MAG: metallopeptidase family protein [Deltaproteobacteria bacterium]|nr:metallopeptidase family protein [Deltaproteobacteria bacterium]
MSLAEAIDEAYEALYDDRLPAAREALARAQRIDAKHPEVRLLEIELLEAADEAEEAVVAAEQAVAALPKSMLLRLKLATLLLDIYDDVPAARPHLEDLAARLNKGEKPDVAGEDADAPRDFAVEVWLTLSDARGSDHDPKGALVAAEKAVALAKDDAAARVALGTARFDLCELDDAEKHVGQALDRDPRSADAWWLRGRIHTVRGDHAAADKAFAKAAQLDPVRFAPPFRVDEDSFARLMEESLEELPEQVRSYLKNIAIAVEDVPALEQVAKNDPPLSPGSLGLFEGTPPSLAPGDDPWSHFPSRITLFRRNIEISCVDEDELRDLVSSTLLHEVGHYLGLDEEDLDERGLG